MAHGLPEPLLSISVDPKTKADQEKMLTGLKLLAADGPTFKVATDPESSQIIIKGKDELHLDILIDRLKRQFKVEADVGAPQVAYLETISREVEHTYTHKKQTGPNKGEYAEVKLVITPTNPGEDFSFESHIVGYAVPTEYVPGVEKGIKSVLGSGPLAGYPVIDLKVALVDGKYFDVDSSIHTFETAARMCMREGLRKAGLKLLEPIMKVEVVTPEDYRAGIIGDLTSRRGIVQAQGDRGDSFVISALVPLASLFGYINKLRSMSSGEANFSMKFDHYAPIPSNDDPGDNFPPAVGVRA